MAVNAEFNRKHPRHKENGRFREKHGVDAGDAVKYAERISDAIGAKRGERKPAKKATPRKRTGGSSNAGHVRALKEALEEVRQAGHSSHHDIGEAMSTKVEKLGLTDAELRAAKAKVGNSGDEYLWHGTLKKAIDHVLAARAYKRRSYHRAS